MHMLYDRPVVTVLLYTITSLSVFCLAYVLATHAVRYALKACNIVGCCKQSSDRHIHDTWYMQTVQPLTRCVSIVSDILPSQHGTLALGQTEAT